VAVPWDYSGIGGELPPGEQEEKEIIVDESRMTPEAREALSIKRQIEERRKEMVDEHEQEQARIDEEFSEANEAYGA
jgi:hypothetical protein